MKDKFEAILKKLGFTNYRYESNWNDIEQGFEFNPEIRTIIELKWSILGPNQPDYNAAVRIIKHEINLNNDKIWTEKMFSGLAIQCENGDIDYNLYEKILKNWRSF